MKIYFREPRPATSGYAPILINYQLSKKLKKEPQLVIDYFDNIFNKSGYSKNTFDKLMELSKARKPDAWGKKKFKEINGDSGVYFFQNGDFPQVKIGWTKDRPEERMKQLQTGNPNKLYLIGLYPTDKKEMEKILHDRFKKYRIDPCGEWFYLSGDLEEYIESLQNIFMKN
jgi:hypothetical protein